MILEPIQRKSLRLLPGQISYQRLIRQAEKCQINPKSNLIKAVTRINKKKNLAAAQGDV